jgi:hypothetical protein
MVVCVYTAWHWAEVQIKIFYIRNSKWGEENWPPDLLKITLSQPKIWTKELLLPVQKEEQCVEVR